MKGLWRNPPIKSLRRGWIKCATVMNEVYPSKYESWTRLKNGREVFLRPVLETDGGLLTALFNRLSSQSIYFRFLNPLTGLSESLLYSLTHVDYSADFALLALVREGGKDSVIGVGRYGFSSEDNFTELAVAVSDDWQNLGLGGILLSRVVAIGRECGISRFVSLISSQNHVIKRVLEGLGCRIQYTSRGGGITRADIFV